MPTVLVTGAARGIGRATVGRLARKGWDVVAGVRQEADGDRLVEQLGGRVQPFVLDITNVELSALQTQLPHSLDAVVNNAGVVVGGPVEALSLDELRHQLEVNVVTPMTGAYNASKFAIEAIADALRMELWPWQVGVSVVEPAQTDTDMWRQADDQLEQTVASVGEEHREPYAQHIEGMRRSIPKSQRMAASPDGRPRWRTAPPVRHHRPQPLA